MTDVDNGEVAANALHVRERGAAVGALYERGLAWVSLSPLSDRPCSIDFAIRQMSGLGLVSGATQGIRHHRTRAQCGDGNDDFSFHLNLSGRSIIAGQGGEITLDDGDGVLLDYAQPRTITRPNLVQYRIVRLPRSSLSPLVRNIVNAVARPIRRGAGALNLLTHYVGALIDDPALAAPRMQQFFATHVSDLIAVTLGATHDGGLVERGALRAARLHAVKRDIERYLASADLSPGAVGRRQGISESYIRKLFEGEGTSFSAFVLQRRLVRAHAMLIDARLAHCSIAAIAFDAGFGDLSYFNRAFRRAYGERPSSIRLAVRISAADVNGRRTDTPRLSALPIDSGL